MSDRQTELLELLDRSGAGLYALLTRLTLREDVAEELMQDLFLKLNGAENQGGIDCWCAYARRTAINLAFDWRRRQATRRACSLDGFPERASDAGALDASARTQGSINVNTYPVYIGGNAEEPGRDWNGLIDDVRIYDYALSEAEVQALMEERERPG